MRYAPVLLALVTLVSTGLGGTAAIRLRDRLHLLLGFSSGAVLAVALFDILPEVFAFDHGASYMPITALGFLAFFGLERAYVTGGQTRLRRFDYDSGKSTLVTAIRKPHATAVFCSRGAALLTSEGELVDVVTGVTKQAFRFPSHKAT